MKKAVEIEKVVEVLGEKAIRNIIWQNRPEDCLSILISMTHKAKLYHLSYVYNRLHMRLNTFQQMFPENSDAQIFAIVPHQAEEKAA